MAYRRLGQNPGYSGKIVAQHTEKGAKMPLTKQLNPESPCPCGSDKSLAGCCLPLIRRQVPAATAEALMRSRYTAHCLQAIDYLWDTWDPQQRQQSSPEDIRQWASSCHWLGLHIVATTAGKENDQQGAVRFIASYIQEGEKHQHREVSLFKKSDNGWLYINQLDS